MHTMEQTDTADTGLSGYGMVRGRTLAALLAITATVAALGASAVGANAASFGSSFLYAFSDPGVLVEAPSAAQSTSPYFWLKSGAELVIENGRGATIQGTLDSANPWSKTYASRMTVQSDNGAHPQNAFFMLTRATAQNVVAQAYFDRTADNFDIAGNRRPYNHEAVIARYQDDNNYYFASVRADGDIDIKKKVNGAFVTLGEAKLFPGAWNASTNPDLIPLNRWVGLKLSVTDTSAGPKLELYTDVGWTNTWTLALSATDASNAIASAGAVGIESNYGDVIFDNFLVQDKGAAAPTPAPAPAPQPTVSSSYDSVVLADNPVMYLGMSSPQSGAEKDLSGHGLSGTYHGTPTAVALPNGDKAADFNGTSQYLSVPSNAALSIPTTGELTWEGWVRADTLSFLKASSDGYVDWMGKCQNYSPTCEWEARMYGSATLEGRPARLSAYVFNPGAGLGSAADWQPSAGQIAAGQWVHVVAEYQTHTTPSSCPSGTSGTINIWVDGVEQSFASHAPTGCMSQFQISPKANNSPLTIGTMAFDTWFKGAVGKVAVYNHLLTPAQINAHFKAMTGTTPAGSCGQTCTLGSAVIAATK